LNGRAFETRSTLTQFDSTGRFVTKAINPLGQATNNIYDEFTGKLASTTDVNNLTTIYSYDDFGRLKKVKYPDGNWQQYDYKYFNINITSSFSRPYNYAIIKQSSSE
jgi:YD repeat-containing protein